MVRHLAKFHPKVSEQEIADEVGLPLALVIEIIDPDDSRVAKKVDKRPAHKTKEFDEARVPPEDPMKQAIRKAKAQRPYQSRNSIPKA